jgi:protein-S-isoprenylcysteine O-methyltransferase Ste14
MLSPLKAVVGVLLAFAVSFFIFFSGALQAQNYFFLPIFLLIAYHTLLMQWQVRHLSITPHPWGLALKKSLGKYLFWLGVIGAAYGIYTHHPFYVRFAPNTATMLWVFLKLYAVLGLPYFLYVEMRRTGRFEWLNDPYLKVLSLTRLIIRRRWQSLRYRCLKSGYKSLLLSWLLRLHFLPVMVEQVYWGTSHSMNALQQPAMAVTYVMFWVGVLFLVDSTNASMGYFWESTLTRTRFRAMDPYAFHWMVVLICYMPFISYASNFIPFPKADGALIIPHAWFEVTVNVLTVAALLGIVVCTSCLGFSYSNLCYKKIQTRGPYAVVRHPGTVFKILFFFLTIFRFEFAYQWSIVAAYLFWMGVYIVRILCEERFLLHFKEYQDYVKVTRYRLLPGIW